MFTEKFNKLIRSVESTLSVPNLAQQIFTQSNFTLTLSKGETLSDPIQAKAVFNIPELAHLPVKLQCQWFLQPEDKQQMIEIPGISDSTLQTSLDDVGSK
jgi:hypothetical protein